MPEVPPPGGETCIPGVPDTSQVSRLLNAEYDRIVEDLLGVATIAGGNKPSDMLNADYEGPMDSFVWNAYQDVAQTIASEVIAGPNKANFISCDPAAVATCYEDTVRSFGRLAFRRPMTDAEVQRFMALTTIEPAGTQDEIAGALLHAFLVSPSFIMTPEMSAEAEGTAFKLTNHEVATRLALTLWGTVPDEALNTAADGGMLTTRDQILAQAERMLMMRDKVAPQLAAAHRHYLVQDDASHWWKIGHDTALYPNYSDSLRPVYQAALDAFFEEVAYSGAGFGDIFTSQVGFVNQDTAALYGLNAADYGPELTRVEFTNRPGFLTRAGFLSSFSSPESTSPILRGAFITVNVLGVDPGAPDPSFANIPPPPGDYSTRREQIEALTEPAECTGCHTPLVNPPGFALENYDAVGQWQETDPLGGPIDSNVTMIFSPEVSMDITSPAQMMEQIAQTPKARRIYSERLVSYLTGRLPNPADACIVEDAALKLASDGYTAVDLLADLTQADSFRLRTVGN